ncbi:hypothetical protein [Streptomyces telluris]|uniref:Uncharacterized protein n=1 Tax=Streptomyces telluris TaxID=2720021 RepID=A0A9X2LP50_9ACTN|nr:hypothetical protein [Streptomyces telluris]MCQ8774803.1 hypothetical protein [Streptomyces telluris]NJP82918.1 hypothetical protein [Streptomyces telluris]
MSTRPARRQDKTAVAMAASLARVLQQQGFTIRPRGGRPRQPPADCHEGAAAVLRWG